MKPRQQRTDAERTSTLSAADSITYEQPLNERLRTFLRLDFLFKQSAHHAKGSSSWDGRATVSSLLDILAILGRGDIRQEITKELERLTADFQKYASQPEVDSSRLDALLSDLDKLRGRLDTSHASATSTLRDSMFLNAIKHRSAIPGGTCEFDLPDYKHWLGLPLETRQKDYEAWMRTLSPLRDGVDRVLWLLRESNGPKQELAKSGMYQHVLGRGISCQMLRVTLPNGTPLFPEISGSAHRFTVRFYEFKDVDSRPSQCTDDVPFLLTCCG